MFWCYHFAAIRLNLERVEGYFLQVFEKAGQKAVFRKSKNTRRWQDLGYSYIQLQVTDAA